jgi:hypothetical protein
MPSLPGLPINDGIVGEGLVSWVTRMSAEGTRSWYGFLFYGGSEEEARRKTDVLISRARSIEDGTWVLPVPTSSPAYRYYEEAYRLLRLGVRSFPEGHDGQWTVDIWIPELGFHLDLLPPRGAVARAMYNIERWMFDSCDGMHLTTPIRFTDDTGRFADSDGGLYYNLVRFPAIWSDVFHPCRNAMTHAESVAWRAFLDEHGVLEWYYNEDNHRLVEEYRHYR